GFLGLPRVGTEVLVAFMGGDPDKPVIVGQLYNGAGLPPALGRGELPENRYLSGMKSREVNGGRANQLRFDDTPGEISAQLASDHGASQLNLGWLTERDPNSKSGSRGEGAELRSDFHAVVRGADGVLISASPGGGVRGKLLSREEFSGTVTKLQTVTRQLARLAQQFAKEEAIGEGLEELLNQIKQLEDGVPLVAVDGPEGVAIASGRSLLLGAATETGISSGGDLHISSAAKVALHAAESLNLFAYQKELKLTATTGKVEVQAQTEALSLLAKKVVEILSTTDWITISAKQGVRINGGGAELVLSADGIKGCTSGEHEMRASGHHFKEGSSKSLQFQDTKACPTQATTAAQGGDASVPLA
ncbi:DUF2345 domain-containing protein, partial [Oxalobacteraceae bacterium A2-2]